ncbi:hypothetical protein RIR_jg13915.t1 [Rhizophagus irregularis DAOM 181602=DAOM 197198]|nr:hypothetical protein RIR_jg13915.t1 [Rhizophagus irregularis DAOM 181602=DAOM 197198]
MRCIVIGPGDESDNRLEELSLLEVGRIDWPRSADQIRPEVFGVFGSLFILPSSVVKVELTSERHVKSSLAILILTTAEVIGELVS